MGFVWGFVFFIVIRCKVRVICWVYMLLCWFPGLHNFFLIFSKVESATDSSRHTVPPSNVPYHDMKSIIFEHYF